MNPEIRLFQPSAEFFTDEGCYINELLNQPFDPKVSIALARVPPSSTTRWHRLHGIVERYVLLEGSGIVEIGDLPEQKVSYGDIVLIPAGIRQRIRNCGNEDLVFLAVCSPRFRHDAYEDIDEENGTIKLT